MRDPSSGTIALKTRSARSSSIAATTGSISLQRLNPPVTKSFKEFKAKWNLQLDPLEEEELRAFYESCEDASDDYDHWIARLRASGKFKSIFANGFGANARRTTNMTTEPVLSDRERREYPHDLYKTILGMAQDRKKPSGLSAAISDFLGEKNPHLQIPNETTLLVPLEA